MSAGCRIQPEVSGAGGWREIGEVGIGTLAGIGGELVRVDGITAAAITVGRGCLDTVPRTHAAGTPVIFFDEGARIAGSTWAREALRYGVALSTLSPSKKEMPSADTARRKRSQPGRSTSFCANLSLPKQHLNLP